MKSTSERVLVTTFHSERMPEITTQDRDCAEIIRWADEHPEAWLIVTGRKSVVYGLQGKAFFGSDRGEAVDSTLRRVKILQEHLEGHESSLDRWRAEFVMKHHQHPKYTGKLFQQHAVWTDGKEYPRLCQYMDFVPDLLKAVTDRFVDWLEELQYLNMTRITVDGENIRVFDEDEQREMNKRCDTLFSESSENPINCILRKGHRGQHRCGDYGLAWT